MPLNIQPPNLSGLAALAGRGQGSLNLPNAGAGLLQAIQIAEQKEAAKRQAALEQMRIQQAGQLGLGQQGIQRAQIEQQGLLAQRQADSAQQRLAFDQQKLAQEGGLDQADLAYKEKLLAQQGALGQAGLDVEKQKLFQQQQAEQMKQLLEEKKEVIQEKGAFASYALMSLNDAKTPEEAQMMWNEITKEAKSKKILPKEQIEQLSRLPLSQRKNALKMAIMNLGMAKEYKAMQDIEDSTGKTTITRPDGTVITLEEPSSAVKTTLQKDIITEGELLSQLKSLKRDYNETYLTTKGQADKWVSERAERVKSFPGLGGVADVMAEKFTGKDPEERSKFVSKSTGYLNSVEQLFQKYRKEVTGAQASEKEIKMLRDIFLNSDMSPSQFQGALDQILNQVRSEREEKKGALRDGMDISPSKTFKYNPETGRLE